MSKPAPHSSMTARANSVTTSQLRRRRPTPSVVPRTPACNIGAIAGREALMAGASPTRMPLTIDTAVVNRRTRRSTPTSLRRGRLRGPIRTRRSTRQSDRITPKNPPAPARSRLSATIGQIRRNRPAPSAARMAISFRRAVARASSRFAMFAVAIKSTSATAPNNTKSAGLTSPTRSPFRGAAFSSQSAGASGNSALTCRATDCSAPPISDGPTSGRGRAIVLRM